MSDNSESLQSPTPSVREVRFEYSHEFPGILQQAGVSLLVSTYQAGKLAVLGTQQGKLTLAFHNFEQAMGVAVHKDRLAVGGKTQVWNLESTPEIANAWRAEGKHDAVYLTRSSHFTDEIHGHEMAWCGDDLWLVNTRFSCLCTLQSPYSFVPRWRPPFVSLLAAEDRCHLNGLCVVEGRPKYVTAMAETDTAGGWRAVKAKGGCLIDVESGETVMRGFAMPHSPRLHGGRVWLLDSGRGHVVTVDLPEGRSQVVTAQPGYTRGLDFAGPFAFVGLSKIRETSTFSGVPIAERRETLKCGVAIVDLRSGKHLAHFEFLSGVEEIFDVRVLTTARNPYLSGPMLLAEGGEAIWFAPVGAVPSSLSSTTRHARSVRPSTNDAQDYLELPDLPADVLQLYHRGNVLAEADEFERAADCFRQAVAAAPDFAAAHCNLGVALQFLRRTDESIVALERAGQLAPEMPAVHMNLAMSLFLRGDFARAWQEYEWRWKCARYGQRPDAARQLAPKWTGELLAGKSILVYGEQGIGDEIMFAGCIPELVPQAARCIVACEPRLMPLFGRSFPTVTVLATESLAEPRTLRKIGHLDFQIAAGSLPQYLRPNLGQLPGRDRYLTVDSTLRQKWQDRLANLGPGSKIGISWRGGKESAEVRRRSVQLEDWLPVFQVSGLQFVNLQYGVQDTELAQVKERFDIDLHHWSDVDPLQNMDDFAALVASVDQVISIDNSTIHLSGALGVPTWMLLAFPSSSYWRWPLAGTQSTWYSSLRICRKPDGGTWRELLAALADELRSKS